MFLTIITFIIILGILVFAHELGHFLVARKLGVKAEEFGFGFPPRIFGFYQDTNGEWEKVLGGKEVNDAPGTVYSINWFPLGGFVKIKGESGENGTEQDSFASRKIWQRASILSAGVIMNIVLAAILISFGFMIGMPQVIDDLSYGARVTDKKIQVMDVLPASRAEVAGIKLGDAILDINSIHFASVAELQKFVDERIGQELKYKIRRGQEELIFNIVPEKLEETGRGGVGIAISEIGLVKYPFYIAIWEGIKSTIVITWAIIVAFFGLLKGIILGQGISADLAGPVGIAALTGQVARLGFVYILQFAAILSINLAIINFLPIPALDGGRVLFLAIEKAKGRPVRRELENIIHNIGFALLMLLVLLVTFRDVTKLSGWFRVLWEKLF